MPAVTRLILALLCAIAAVDAAAASTYVDIEQQLSPQQRRDTGVDTLTPQQLQLLNRLLREKAEAVAPSDDTAGTTPPPAADRPHRHAAEDTAGAMPLDLEIRTLRSRVRGPVAGWEPGTEFRLENGQTWKVLKGEMRLRQVLESPEILVVPGVAGRWFLQVHEDYPKARVYRVD